MTFCFPFHRKLEMKENSDFYVSKYEFHTFIRTEMVFIYDVFDDTCQLGLLDPKEQSIMNV